MTTSLIPFDPVTGGLIAVLTETDAVDSLATQVILVTAGGVFCSSIAVACLVVPKIFWLSVSREELFTASTTSTRNTSTRNTSTRNTSSVAPTSPGDLLKELSVDELKIHLKWIMENGSDDKKIVLIAASPGAMQLEGTPLKSAVDVS